MKYTRDISIVTVLMFQLIISAEKVGLSENVISLEHNAFDDQYVGCEKTMEMKAKELLAQERAMNSNFDEAWVEAENIWKKKKSKNRMEMLFEIAVIAYTLENPKIYSAFNEAVRKCCESREAYMNNFHFKALHFYLTRAVQIMRRSCKNVYRGVSVKVHREGAKEMRFGQFASTSLKEDKARSFAKTSGSSGTLFKVYTCEGASIEDLSFYPDEREVLIPPYEVFSVSEPEKNGLKTFELRSTRTYSKFNCAYQEGSIHGACKDPVPEPQLLHFIPLSPFLAELETVSLLKQPLRSHIILTRIEEVPQAIDPVNQCSVQNVVQDIPNYLWCLLVRGASANKVAVPEQLTTILFSGVLTLVLQAHSQILI